MLQIRPGGFFYPIATAIACMLFFTAQISAEETLPLPAFYMDDALDILYEPLLEEQVLFPSYLVTIVEHYRAQNYRLAALELGRIDSMNVPDGRRDIVLLMLGECYRKLGIGSIAMEYYSEILCQYTNSTLRVLALYRMQDYYYREALYDRSDSMTVIFEEQYGKHNLYSASLYLRAKGLMRQERFLEAVQVLDNIPKNSDYYIAGCLLNGLCHAIRSNISKALVFFDYVASTSGNEALADEARLIEADLYSQMNKHQTALNMYNNISASAQRADYVLMRKVNIYYNMGNYQTAREIGEQLLEAYPESEFIFDICLLLERCYRALNDSVRIREIKAYVDQYARNFRTLSLVSNEFKRLIEINTSWNQLESKAYLVSEAAGNRYNKYLASETQKIRTLQKELEAIQDHIDPTKRRRIYVGRSGIAEQRYLGILTKDIETAKRDSADTFINLQTTLLDLEISDDNQEARLLREKAASLQQSYTSICEDLNSMRQTKTVVQRACMAQHQVDRYTENMQAKFVDWGIIRNDNLKQAIQDKNAMLTKENLRIQFWRNKLNEEKDSTGTLQQKIKPADLEKGRPDKP
jgi:tetratricopeptide (TPR) repeat protein